MTTTRFTLNNGVEIPAVGFGGWPLEHPVPANTPLQCRRHRDLPAGM